MPKLRTVWAGCSAAYDPQATPSCFGTSAVAPSAGLALAVAHCMLDVVPWTPATGELITILSVDPLIATTSVSLKGDHGPECF